MITTANNKVAVGVPESRSLKSTNEGGLKRMENLHSLMPMEVVLDGGGYTKGDVVYLPSSMVMAAMGTPWEIDGTRFLAFEAAHIVAVKWA